eukprot:356968-Chlamydomonas_euryale.AAC.7
MPTCPPMQAPHTAAPTAKLEQPIAGLHAACRRDALPAATFGRGTCPPASAHARGAVPAARGPHVSAGSRCRPLRWSATMRNGEVLCAQTLDADQSSPGASLQPFSAPCTHVPLQRAGPAAKQHCAATVHGLAPPAMQPWYQLQHQHSGLPSLQRRRLMCRRLAVHASENGFQEVLWLHSVSGSPPPPHSLRSSSSNDNNFREPPTDADAIVMLAGGQTDKGCGTSHSHALDYNQAVCSAKKCPYVWGHATHTPLKASHSMANDPVAPVAPQETTCHLGWNAVWTHASGCWRCRPSHAPSFASVSTRACSWPAKGSANCDLSAHRACSLRGVLQLAIQARMPPEAPGVCRDGVARAAARLWGRAGAQMHASCGRTACTPVPAPQILARDLAVGNAYFSLTIHALPAMWRNIIVVTSDFHMPRSCVVPARMPRNPYPALPESESVSESESQGADPRRVCVCCA